MKKGGGKSKGGAYENIIARHLALRFKAFRITEDDCYRTKNSGATKKQPGDIQFSPAMSKVFPAIIECKHYKNILIKICVPLDRQPKSYPIKAWWIQLLREQKDVDKKFGANSRFALLIMRQNRCPDMVAFAPQTLSKVLPTSNIRSAKFRNIIKTSWKTDIIWIVPLSDFLDYFVEMRNAWLPSMKSAKH